MCCLRFLAFVKVLVHSMQVNGETGFIKKINARCITDFGQLSITCTGWSHILSPSQSLISSNSPSWVPIVQQSSVAFLKGNGQLLKKVPDGGGFFFTSMPGQCTAQFSDLQNCRLVPGAKAFHSKWQENNPLLVAGLPRLFHFALVQVNGFSPEWVSICSFRHLA